MSYGRVHEIADVRAVAESKTGSAILCVLPDRTKEWVPRSQIHELSDVHDKGDEGILTVTWWLAVKKGWVEDDG